MGVISTVSLQRTPRVKARRTTLAQLRLDTHLQVRSLSYERKINLSFLHSIFLSFLVDRKLCSISWEANPQQIGGMRQDTEKKLKVTYLEHAPSMTRVSIGERRENLSQTRRHHLGIVASLFFPRTGSRYVLLVRCLEEQIPCQECIEPIRYSTGPCKKGQKTGRVWGP